MEALSGEPGGVKEGFGVGHLFPWGSRWETWYRAHMPRNAKRIQAKRSQAKLSQVKLNQAKRRQAKPSEAKQSQANPNQAKRSQA